MSSPLPPLTKLCEPWVSASYIIGYITLGQKCNMLHVLDL